LPTPFETQEFNIISFAKNNKNTLDRKFLPNVLLQIGLEFAALHACPILMCRLNYITDT
jgi:hypothetical protein